MKVIKSEDDLLRFDNGVEIFGIHDQDCCEKNYLDFEQLPIGTELPDMNAKQLHNSIKVKQDGIIIKDKEGTPKWVQARSVQNGYYSNSVGFVIKDKDYTYQSSEVLQGEEMDDW